MQSDKLMKYLGLVGTHVLIFLPYLCIALQAPHEGTLSQDKRQKPFNSVGSLGKSSLDSTWAESKIVHPSSTLNDKNKVAMDSLLVAQKSSRSNKNRSLRARGFQISIGGVDVLKYSSTDSAHKKDEELNDSSSDRALAQNQLDSGDGFPDYEIQGDSGYEAESDLDSSVYIDDISDEPTHKPSKKRSALGKSLQRAKSKQTIKSKLNSKQRASNNPDLLLTDLYRNGVLGLEGNHTQAWLLDYMTKISNGLNVSQTDISAFKLPTESKASDILSLSKQQLNLANDSSSLALEEKKPIVPNIAVSTKTVATDQTNAYLLASISKQTGSQFVTEPTSNQAKVNPSAATQNSIPTMSNLPKVDEFKSMIKNILYHDIKSALSASLAKLADMQSVNEIIQAQTKTPVPKDQSLTAVVDGGQQLNYNQLTDDGLHSDDFVTETSMYEQPLPTGNSDLSDNPGNAYNDAQGDLNQSDLTENNGDHINERGGNPMGQDSSVVESAESKEVTTNSTLTPTRTQATVNPVPSTTSKPYQTNFSGSADDRSGSVTQSSTQPSNSTSQSGTKSYESQTTAEPASATITEIKTVSLDKTSKSEVSSKLDLSTRDKGRRRRRPRRKGRKRNPKKDEVKTNETVSNNTSIATIQPNLTTIGEAYTTSSEKPQSGPTSITKPISTETPTKSVKKTCLNLTDLDGKISPTELDYFIANCMDSNKYIDSSSPPAKQTTTKTKSLNYVTSSTTRQPTSSTRILPTSIISSKPRTPRGLRSKGSRRGSKQSKRKQKK